MANLNLWLNVTNSLPCLQQPQTVHFRNEVDRQGHRLAHEESSKESNMLLGVSLFWRKIPPYIKKTIYFINYLKQLG